MADKNNPDNSVGSGANWVDFKELKQKVTLEMALRHYDLWDKLKKSGGNLVGCCPIHQGSNPRQFSVDPAKNIFNCFGNCKSGGNVLDFVVKMEKVSIREAALMLKAWFKLDADEPTDRKRVKEKKEHRYRGAHPEKELPDPPGHPPSGRENPPLNFELKSLETGHPFFAEREIEPETVEHFGLGFCARGILKGRIAIPIHNELGQLVAYCGRAVTDEQTGKEGKYKLPPKFVKSALLYNLHRQKDEKKCFILVESFLSVFHLHQAGLSNVLALMGSALSAEQEKLIVGRLGPDGKAILLFDADESGRTCAEDCLSRLGRRLFVKPSI
jgi:DNA primase